MIRIDAAAARRLACLAGMIGALSAAQVLALDPKDRKTLLDHKEFYRPDLTIATSNVPLDEALAQLPNRAAWEGFLRRSGAAGATRVMAFVDPRTGTTTNLLGAFPLIPGSGVGNAVSLADLSRQLGRPVAAVDSEVVAEAAMRFVTAHAALLGIDVAQLGPVRARPANADLWHVTIPQVLNGIPVRHGRIAAAISHGNLVTIGTESWMDARIDVTPSLNAAQAMDAGFAYVEGRTPEDVILKEPSLVVIPLAAPEFRPGPGIGGPLGSGYRHQLAWSFVFQRSPENPTWEILVDARNGEVLAMQDQNHYVAKQATGGVYPLTNTGICPTPQTCGVMQEDTPMPWANTGLPAPNNFTNSAGIYDYTSGTVTSTLNGKFVRVADTCGPISLASPTGDLAFGGTNGQHDCTTPGVGGAGNTSASRSCFYEVAKIKEQARGWLPANSWLNLVQVSNVNIIDTCNAFYNGSSINFYRSGGGCSNTGEIAAVFDHEWGHALDDNDTGGSLSNSSEGYADIAGIYRLQASCVGYNFTLPPAGVCGLTSDGTGRNRNENQVGGLHCNVDCSGVRDADWARHNPNTPDTPVNFVCGQCLSGSGPCGRQVHCAAAPARQAAWDLVARDLRTAPFNLDSQTAFIVANKLFYQGSGNIGLWHSCDCAGGTSNGCATSSGYMQWVAADDDNGSLADGTPHMTAIFDAFNRHAIACSNVTPTNGGCGAGPSAAATLTGSAGSNQNSLSWTTVPGATRYWVFRSEGYAGCDFGKALITETTGTSYVDTEVANDRPYYYNVVAAGASAACYGPISNCLTLTPSASAQAVAAAALAVDTAGNAVFEPNETVTLAPTWRNTGGVAIALSGATSNFTGPAGPTYSNPDTTASYGTLGVTAEGSCTTTGDCYSVLASATTRPLTHWDSSILETVTPTATTKDWTLHIGDSFADVPRSNGFYRYIETILHKDVTGGCTTTTYCPASSTTREQMAVFVLVSKEPVGYAPPACGATPRFPDVPVSSPFCPWVEELERRGVVAGCGGVNYCPDAAASREQMAVFVLRTLDPTLDPPACVPGAEAFFDVPASSGFCRWIEELVRRGVVTGCGGQNYCPGADVSREQMAVFLAVTFGLTLYGL